MTRVIVYSAAVVALVTATAMTLTSILTPRWVSYAVTSPSATLTRTLGLHQSCTTESYQTTCRPFPSSADCDRDGSSFCSMWRTVGWLLSLATILEMATLVGFVLVLAGGKARRETGWRVPAVLLGVVGVVLFSGMAVVAYLFDNNDRFSVPGWRLDSSWILCTVSAAITVLGAVGLALSAYMLPPEDGYEFLDD